MSSIYSTDINEATKNQQTEAIPYAFTSTRLPMPITSANRIVQLPSAYGSNFDLGLGNMIVFNFPTGPGAGYVKNQSVYLRVKVRLNFTAGATTWKFGYSEATAAAIIHTIRVSIGGVPVETISNYGALHNILLGHFQTASYTTRTANIMEGALQDGTSGDPGSSQGIGANVLQGGTSNKIYSFCIPLALNTFQGSKALPLFLCGQQPVNISIDLNSPGGALYSDGQVDSVSIIDPVLIYEQINIPLSLESAIINSMRSENKIYELPITTFTNYMTSLPANVPLTWTQNVNLNNMLGLIWAPITTSIGSNTSSKYFTKAYTDNPIPQIRFLIDGAQVNNFNLSTEDSLYDNLSRVGATVFDSQVSTRYHTSSRNPISNSSVNLYNNRGFVSGLSTKVFNENSVLGRGKMAGTLNLYIDSNASSAATYYIYTIYQANILIDGFGNVSLFR